MFGKTHSPDTLAKISEAQKMSIEQEKFILCIIE